MERHSSNAIRLTRSTLTVELSLHFFTVTGFNHLADRENASKVCINQKKEKRFISIHQSDDEIKMKPSSSTVSCSHLCQLSSS